MRRLINIIVFITLAFGGLISNVFAQTGLFGLGETAEGYYQLDRSTITRVGNDSASAWVVITTADESEAKEQGADVMLVMYLLGCSDETVQPMAWKAKNLKNQIIGEGVHGKEKTREPKPGSMDERVLTYVCENVSSYTKPPTLYSKGWTQESTGSSESGPWLNYDPPGTRYERMADGTIFRFFPPGVRPDAEQANPFALDTSTDRPPLN